MIIKLPIVYPQYFWKSEKIRTLWFGVRFYFTEAFPSCPQVKDYPEGTPPCPGGVQRPGVTLGHVARGAGRRQMCLYTRHTEDSGPGVVGTCSLSMWCSALSLPQLWHSIFFEDQGHGDRAWTVLISIYAAPCLPCLQSPWGPQRVSSSRCPELTQQERPGCFEGAAAFVHYWMSSLLILPFFSLKDKESSLDFSR